MSLVFSDTSATEKDGILQGIEERLFGDNGDGRITGNALLLARFTASINRALDRFKYLTSLAEGSWQEDDFNHTDYPIIYLDLISGQRDYPFNLDENSNVINEIFGVMVADSSGKFTELGHVDMYIDKDTKSFWDGNNSTGKPIRYDTLQKSIFLDPVPNYNMRAAEEGQAGIKIFTSRENSYFITTDTTKKAGIVGLFHEYLVIRPSWQYANANGLTKANGLFAEMIQMEEDAKAYYATRNKGIPRRMTAGGQNNR